MQTVRVKIVFLLSVLSLLGCGEPRYFPVTGIVVDENGTPLKELSGATIVFDAVGQAVSAVGEIEDDGRFSLTSEVADDGCLPGEHRVTVGQVFSDGDVPTARVIDPKYHDGATSGLTVTVEKKRNDLRITLKRYQPAAE